MTRFRQCGGRGSGLGLADGANHPSGNGDRALLSVSNLLSRVQAVDHGSATNIIGVPSCCSRQAFGVSNHLSQAAPGWALPTAVSP